MVLNLRAFWLRFRAQRGFEVCVCVCVFVLVRCSRGSGELSLSEFEAFFQILRASIPYELSKTAATALDVADAHLFPDSHGPSCGVAGITGMMMP